MQKKIEEYNAKQEKILKLQEEQEQKLPSNPDIKYNNKN